MTTLEKIARAIECVKVQNGQAYTLDECRDEARAALGAMREPSDSFMRAMYPNPTQDVGRCAETHGRRSREAGRRQIAHFIDTILAGEGLAKHDAGGGDI